MKFDEWFKKTGKSNKDAARELDVTPNYISMLRNDWRNPSVGMIRKILKMTDNLVPITVWFHLLENAEIEYCCEKCGKVFISMMPAVFCDEHTPTPFDEHE